MYKMFKNEQEGLKIMMDLVQSVLTVQLSSQYIWMFSLLSLESVCAKLVGKHTLTLPTGSSEMFLELQQVRCCAHCPGDLS